MWPTRRRKRAAINQAQIRRKFHLMEQFFEGRRAYRETLMGVVAQCPYELKTKKAQAWMHGFQSEMRDGIPGPDKEPEGVRENESEESTEKGPGSSGP